MILYVDVSSIPVLDNRRVVVDMLGVFKNALYGRLRISRSRRFFRLMEKKKGLTISKREVNRIS